MHNDDPPFTANTVGWLKAWWLLVMLTSPKHISIYFYFLIDVSLDQVELRDSWTFDAGFGTKTHKKRHHNFNKNPYSKTI